MVEKRAKKLPERKVFFKRCFLPLITNSEQGDDNAIYPVLVFALWKLYHEWIFNWIELCPEIQIVLDKLIFFCVKALKRISIVSSAKFIYVFIKNKGLLRMASCQLQIWFKFPARLNLNSSKLSWPSPSQSTSFIHSSTYR